MAHAQAGTAGDVIDEHAQLERVMKELEQTDPGDSRFDTLMGRIRTPHERLRPHAARRAA